MGLDNRQNIAVSGPVGSGKTFLMRTLLQEVPADERVILLEDVHEVHSERQKEIGYMRHGTDDGRVPARECLKACMRLPPPIASS